MMIKKIVKKEGDFEKSPKLYHNIFLKIDHLKRSEKCAKKNL